MQPEVSIIIVTYNSKYVEECIRSVRVNKYPQNRMEIIIVDSNSQADYLSSLKKSPPDITIVSLKENHGYGAACNRGADAAHGKYLIFLTPDNVVTEDWLQNLVNTIKSDRNIGTATSKVMYYETKNKINSLGCFLSMFGICGSLESFAYIKNSALNIFAPSGASFIISDELFKKIKGFDENLFLYAEDVDLGWRVLNMGQRNVVSSNSVTYHRANTSTVKKGAYFYFFNTRNNLMIIIKNGTLPFMIPMIVFSAFFQIMRSIAFFMVGRVSHSISTVRGIIAAFTNIKKAIDMRASWSYRNTKYVKFVTGIKDSVPILLTKIFKHLS